MRYCYSRCFAAILLCLYGIAGTPLAPCIFATFADYSGEHEVEVEMVEGSSRILLHHHASTFTPSVADHPRKLDQLLTCLCSGSDSGDHVFANAVTTLAREETGANGADSLIRHSMQDSVPCDTEVSSFPLGRAFEFQSNRCFDPSAPRDLRPLAGLGGVILVI